MAIIPSTFISAVVAIGVEIENNQKAWVGTGFIVCRREKNNDQQPTFYIITNKHVLRGKRTVYIRFNAVQEDFIKDYKVSLIDEQGNITYSEHPVESVDVIALQIIPETLIKDKSIWGSFDLETNALTLEEMQNTGVTEGTLVYSLGFPMNLVDVIKTPICRLGCISRVFDAFLRKNKNPIFLIDAQTFPGNSGGPVVNRPEHQAMPGTPTNNSCNLIGILSGYIRYKDTLISQQTGEIQMIQTENSGLTIVHPVDRIKETVEIEWNRCNKNNINDGTVQN